MSDFIWIASFPKSGSTWLRFILAHLLFDPKGDNSVIREMVPNIHDWRGNLKYDWQGAFPVKTHLAQHNLPVRMHSRAAIYIYRNPLDVIDSTLSYMNPKTDPEREDLISQFCMNGAVEPWGKTLAYGSWEENLESWTAGSLGFPVLSLRYEDMLDSTQENIRRIADFLSVDVTDDKIDHVIRETSFDQMKKEEALEISTGASGVFTDERTLKKEEFRFMRSGKGGTYRENLRADEIDRLMERFRPTMETVGYS